jgi:hypothetical protein
VSPVGETGRGKRTGPALNPLKGSSARLPTAFTGANQEPRLTILFSIPLSLDSRVKMLYHP